MRCRQILLGDTTRLYSVGEPYLDVEVEKEPLWVLGVEEKAKLVEVKQVEVRLVEATKEGAIVVVGVIEAESQGVVGTEEGAVVEAKGEVEMTLKAYKRSVSKSLRLGPNRWSIQILYLLSK